MDNLESVILFLIDQTSKKAKRQSQNELEPLGFDVTIDQWVLLKIIEEKSGLSQQELAETSGRDRASITRSVDILEKKSGYVERRLVGGNRRQNQILLTKDGESFIEKFMPKVEEIRGHSLKGFSKLEVEKLKGMLIRIQKNLE